MSEMSETQITLSDKNEDRYNIRAVERALLVFDAFARERRKLSLDELTRLTGLSKSTVFRLLSTLQNQNYILMDKKDGSYRLGSVFLTIASAVLDSLNLRTITRPFLNELRNKAQTTVLLGVLLEDHLVHLDKSGGRGPVRLAADIGWRRDPPNYGMLGMILMAFLEPFEVDRLLREYPLSAYTPKSLTDPGLFCQRLAEIRESGYVVEFEETMDGVWGVAAPVWNSDCEVIAAVGAVLPMTVKSDKCVAETLNLVKICSGEISAALGYRG